MDLPADVVTLVRDRPRGEHPSPAFKQAAVRYIMANIPPKGHRRGRTKFLNEVAGKLGVNITSLYAWMPASEKNPRRHSKRHTRRPRVARVAASTQPMGGKNELRVLAAQILTTIDRLNGAHRALDALLRMYA